MLFVSGSQSDDWIISKMEIFPLTRAPLCDSVKNDEGLHSDTMRHGRIINNLARGRRQVGYYCGRPAAL